MMNIAFYIMVTLLWYNTSVCCSQHPECIVQIFTNLL